MRQSSFSKQTTPFYIIKKIYILGISLANNLSLSQFVHHMQIPHQLPNNDHFLILPKKKLKIKNLLLLIMT